MLKQVTIEVVGYVTVIMDEKEIKKEIPIKIDVPTCEEDETSKVIDVCETEIVKKEVKIVVDMGNVCICSFCQNDFSEKNSVLREYVNKDEGESKFSSGHYVNADEFTPDKKADLSDGRYDLSDNSDRCSECKKVIFLE